MGRLPIKYLRFSLLVASVFIFAGSARASDNKNTSIDVQVSNTTIVSSSSTIHDAQSALTDNSNTTGTSTKNSGGTKSAVSGVTATVAADGANIKSDSITSDKVASPMSATSDNSVNLSKDQSPLLVPAKISGKSSGTAEVSAPISAKLAKYKVASKMSGNGESAHYASSQPSLIASQPVSPATSNQGPSIPISQSEMLVASLSHLLLSPNILSEMTGLGILPVSSVAMTSLLVALACLSVVLIVFGLSSSYISNLKKSRYWHAARSVTLSKLLLGRLFLSGLAQSNGFYRRQTLFIVNMSRLDHASLSMGGNI